MSPLVSIPSRRVGDLAGRGWSLEGCLVSIPSRRVGDDAVRRFEDALADVSIPSRRVGDLQGLWGERRYWVSFHPLKAGRRQMVGEILQEVRESFHPLKAGRRPQCVNHGLRKYQWFPSPQGGSETLRLVRKRSGSPAFPSPQGGSETWDRNQV